MERSVNDYEDERRHPSRIFNVTSRKTDVGFGKRYVGFSKVPGQQEVLDITDVPI
jgi:hypothetical protein